MKIKTKVLTSFLKKFRMSGKQAITEGIFRFEKDGLKVNGNLATKQARSMCWLKSTAFVAYEEIGNVGINDLENFIRVLDRFGEDVVLVKEGNLLTIKGGNKKVDISLISEGFLDTDTGEPELEFSDTFTITSSELKDILKDVQMNSDAVLKIETKEKKVVFTNTGKYKFKTVKEAETCKGGVSVEFGEPFIDAVLNLDGELNISVGSDYPCKVMEKLDTSVISIIVAPRVEDE